MNRCILEPVEVANWMVNAQASIGIALSLGRGSAPVASLRRAPCRALRRLCHGCRRPGTGNTWRLALMGDLRRAMEHNELVLNCQPKVNIASPRVCGTEVLASCAWHDADGGMYRNEGAGWLDHLVRKLWMLDAAFSQRHAWHEAGLEWLLSANLSAQDLHDLG